MAARNVDLRDLAKKFRSLGSRYMPTVMAGARSAGERARAYLVQESQSKKVVDRGGYIRGWKSLVIGNTLEVYNQAPYSGVLEYGRRPGAKPPPYYVLIPWVQRHLKIDRVIKSGKRKGTSTSRAPKGSELIGLAIAVAKSIGKRGQKGHFILTKSRKKIEGFILLEVKDALQRASGIV